MIKLFFLIKDAGFCFLVGLTNGTLISQRKVIPFSPFPLRIIYMEMYRFLFLKQCVLKCLILK